jgi:hypothetical protein
VDLTYLRQARQSAMQSTVLLVTWPCDPPQAALTPTFHECRELKSQPERAKVKTAPDGTVFTLEGQVGLDLPSAGPPVSHAKHSFAGDVALRPATGGSHHDILLICRGTTPHDFQ